MSEAVEKYRKTRLFGLVVMVPFTERGWPAW